MPVDTNLANDDIFYPRIMTGIETTISQNGYHCLVQSINENSTNAGPTHPS